MVKERQHYDRDFKENAVELARIRGNISEVARELGIRSELLYRWNREKGRYGEGGFSGRGNKNIAPEDKELALLAKENNRLKMENEILKKALGIVSKSDR